MVVSVNENYNYSENNIFFEDSSGFLKNIMKEKLILNMKNYGVLTEQYTLLIQFQFLKQKF